MGLTFLFVGACRSEIASFPTLGGRWIEEDPQVLFEPEDRLERFLRFEWRLDLPEESSDFALVNHPGPLRTGEEGIEVPFARPFPKLRRAVELEAAQIHLIEVEIEGAARGRVQLFWAGPGQGDSAERKIQVPSSGFSDGRVVFDVSSHPNWTGSIRNVSLTPTTAPGQTVRVKAVRGFERRIDPDALTPAIARPWKVRLGKEVRNALLAPPGLRLEKEFDIPRDGLLRLAYGARPQAFEAIDFRVSLLDGSEEVMLMERRLVPASEPGWREAEIDLAAYGGRRVSLVLETITATRPDLSRMMPVWGNPEVLGRAATPRPPNIILISVDTLRADRMSAYGHARPTTPGLETWARDSAVRFETVVAPSPWTLPSHVSMFTGLDAVTHGVNFGAPADPSLVTLAELLRDAGYSTAAFTAGAYLNPQFGLAQGFDLFLPRQDAPSGKEADELERGLAEVRAWLDRPAGRPFFLFFHTYEVHAPFRARQPFFRRFGGGELDDRMIATRPVPADERDGFLQAKEFVLSEDGRREGAAVGASDGDLVGIAYDSGVAFMDHHVSRFLAELSARGLDSDTVIVLTSDHGEMLGEHGLAAHGYLYDENLLIPLIMSLPGGRGAGTTVGDQVRLVDLFPTLLALAGIEPSPSLDGESLLPFVDRRGGAESRHRQAWSYAASTNYGLSLRVADRMKYVFRNAVWPTELGKDSIFDLRSDPRELHDRATDDARAAAARAEARRYLEQRASGLRVRFSNPGPATLSGTISGPPIRVSGVTSPDLSCSCLHWQGKNTLSFEIPPGEEFTVHLEQAGPDRLEITSGLREGTPEQTFRGIVDAGQLDAPFEVAHGGGGWASGTPQETAVAGASAARIRIWWQGEVSSRGEITVEDEELRQQLEALGYLN